MPIRRWVCFHRAPCHTRKVTDLSNSHRVHGGARSEMASVRPPIPASDKNESTTSTLVEGTDRVGHDTVVPAHGCIIWCADGQSGLAAATSMGSSWWDTDAMAVWWLPGDITGVTECISNTPRTVSTISNPVAEAKPGRLRRITDSMSPTIARHTP